MGGPFASLRLCARRRTLSANLLACKYLGASSHLCSISTAVPPHPHPRPHPHPPPTPDPPPSCRPYVHADVGTISTYGTDSVPLPVITTAVRALDYAPGAAVHAVLLASTACDDGMPPEGRRGDPFVGVPWRMRPAACPFPVVPPAAPCRASPLACPSCMCPLARPVARDPLGLPHSRVCSPQAAF